MNLIHKIFSCIHRNFKRIESLYLVLIIFIILSVFNIVLDIKEESISGISRTKVNITTNH